MPTGVTATGADGALWFTNYQNNSVGRITTGGSVSNYTGTGINTPIGIASGPDGALWFTNYNGNSIGRITTGGSVTNFVGTQFNGTSNPAGITVGPDGALWFTNFGNNSIGRITTSGVITDYLGASINQPFDIASGADGAALSRSPTLSIALALLLSRRALDLAALSRSRPVVGGSALRSCRVPPPPAVALRLKYPDDRPGPLPSPYGLTWWITALLLMSRTPPSWPLMVQVPTVVDGV